MTTPSHSEPGLEHETESTTDTFFLFRLARGGDREALGRLLERYQERLCRIVKIRLHASESQQGHPIAAREILRQLRSLEPSDLQDADPATLPELLQFLAERIQDSQERSREGRSHGGPSAPPVPKQYPFGRRPLPHEISDDSGLAVEREWAHHLRELLDHEVRDLPHEYKEIILMRDYCSAPWHEIGMKVGIREHEDLLMLHARAWEVLKSRVRDQVRSVF
ncbi:MAG: hypothetical protein ACI841_004408 [Planctomycetota bacterium]|jgi:hypothetical protein